MGTTTNYRATSFTLQLVLISKNCHKKMRAGCEPDLYLPNSCINNTLDKARETLPHYFTDTFYKTLVQILKIILTCPSFYFQKPFESQSRPGVNYPTWFSFVLKIISNALHWCYQLGISLITYSFEPEGGVWTWNWICMIRQQLILCCSWSFIVMWSTWTFCQTTMWFLIFLSLLTPSIQDASGHTFDENLSLESCWLVRWCTIDLTTDKIIQYL